MRRRKSDTQGQRRIRLGFTKFLVLGIILIIGAVNTYAQQEREISGVVTDQNSNEPLIGVSVAIKGSNTGTVTDLDGKFTLKAPETSTLVFSYVGFLPEEITVLDQTEITVSLVPDVVSMTEVVVVGFGTQKKINLTGAVETVDTEILEGRPSQNSALMLQGVVAGLNITQNSGSLDGSPNINIRGVTTIGNGSSGNPLVLIDGLEGDLATVNPNDIENVSVLKDVAASSIYGSRAPFGVILITTKSGKVGKTTISYSNNFRESKPINIPNMMDSYNFALFFNEAAINRGESPFFTEERLQRILDYQNGVINTTTIPYKDNPDNWGDGYSLANANVNWYEALYRDKAYSQEHNLSITGGSDNVQYYFTGNYLGQNGLMVFNQDKSKRYSLALKINAKLNDWLSVNFSERYLRNEFGRPSNLTDGFFQDLARQSWPTAPVYDPNGHLALSLALGLRDGGRDKKQDDQKSHQIQFIFEPIKGWKTYASVNYRISDNFRHWDLQVTNLYDVNEKPYEFNKGSAVYEEAYRENFLTSDVYTEYVKNLNSGHHFKGMVGVQVENEAYRKLSVSREGIIIPGQPVINLATGYNYKAEKSEAGINGENEGWSTFGVFGRLNYDYKERYLFEANLRHDGTSRFRKDKRWKTFPSLSAGWNISKEDFWNIDRGLISSLKLRGSWGELGNQNADEWYPTYETLGFEASKGWWLVNGAKPNISYPGKLVSESLTWERVSSWDFGLDMAFFNNRLQANVDFYGRYTNDMIGPAEEMPATLGTAVPKTNNTDLKTIGYEIRLMWKDRLENGLGYSATFSLSDYQTTITRFPNKTGSLSKYIGGRKYGEIWGYETVGIAQSNEEMNTHLSSLSNGGQNALGSDWAAGDIMYKDLNNDGKIDQGANTEGDHGDLKVIGNSTPRYATSLNLTADWKGFDVSAFFQGILKRDYFRNNYYFWGAGPWGMWWSTGFKEHEDYYRDENSSSYAALGSNKNAYYPRPLFGSDKNQKTQTRYLQNAAYIRFKNLQVGYTLPESITSRIHIQKLRVYVSGENLYTWTKLTKIFDPETVNADNSSDGDNNSGYAGNTYPISKVYSVGLNLTF